MVYTAIIYTTNGVRTTVFPFCLKMSKVLCVEIECCLLAANKLATLSTLSYK